MLTIGISASVNITIKFKGNIIIYSIQYRIMTFEQDLLERLAVKNDNEQRLQYLLSLQRNNVYTIKYGNTTLVSAPKEYIELLQSYIKKYITKPSS